MCPTNVNDRLPCKTYILDRDEKKQQRENLRQLILGWINWKRFRKSNCNWSNMCSNNKNKKYLPLKTIAIYSCMMIFLFHRLAVLVVETSLECLCLWYTDSIWKVALLFTFSLTCWQRKNIERIDLQRAFWTKRNFLVKIMV